jgi:hypothetical protein
LYLDLLAWNLQKQHEYINTSLQMQSFSTSIEGNLSGPPNPTHSNQKKGGQGF